MKLNSRQIDQINNQLLINVLLPSSDSPLTLVCIRRGFSADDVSLRLTLNLDVTSLLKRSNTVAHLIDQLSCLGRGAFEAEIVKHVDARNRNDFRMGLDIKLNRRRRTKGIVYYLELAYKLEPLSNAQVSSIFEKVAAREDVLKKLI